MNKICLIIHSLGIGGMERVMHQLVTQFVQKDNLQMDLVLIGRKRDIVYPLPASVNIHRPPFEFDNSGRKISTWRTIRFLRKRVKEINPDNVLSFGEYWNNLVLLALYGLDYPIFISDRSEPNKDLGKLQNFLRDLLYPAATGYIAQTQEAKNVCLANEWNKNVKVIGNPIKRVLPNRALDKENIVLSVGRIIETKHFDQLIRIFADINKPDWKLFIVGGDTKRLTLSKDLKRLVQELEMEESIHLVGECSDVDHYYNRSSIFAFTSSSEGFPNVVGEALSAGLPVVAYDSVAGTADMIQDGENGYLVPLFDQKKFQERLQNLIEDQHMRNLMSTKAKECIEEFNPEYVSEKYFSFIFGRNYSTTKEKAVILQ